MADTPTQVQHPWYTTARSIFQFAMGLLVIVPVIIAELGLADSIPWVAGALAVAAAVARVMAIPAVVEFLKQWAPWLSPTGKTDSSS